MINTMKRIILLTVMATLITGCGWQAEATNRQRLRSAADTQIANANRDATIGAAEANAAAKVGVARADADAREAEANAKYKIESDRQWARIESARIFAYTMPILAILLIVGLLSVAYLFFSHAERTQAAQLATVARALPQPPAPQRQALPASPAHGLDLYSMQALAAQHNQRIEFEGNTLYLVDNATGATLDQKLITG